MELRMTSLVPEETLAELEAHLGERFHSLSQTERMALIIASSEGVVSHARLLEVCTEHRADVSKMLSRLAREGLLLSDGIGRGMVYYLPWKREIEDALFDLRTSVTHLVKGNLIPPELGAIPPELSPQYLEWDELPTALQEELMALSLSVRNKRRVSPEEMQQVVLSLCQGRFLGRRVLADLLKRNPDDLLKRILNPMVRARILTPAFASSQSPKQAYMAATPEKL